MQLGQLSAGLAVYPLVIIVIRAGVDRLSHQLLRGYLEVDEATINPNFFHCIQYSRILR